MKKDLTKMADFTADDAERVVNSAVAFREKHDRGIRREDLLGGRVVAMIFEKPSLRTKVAFEVGAAYLGGNAVFLSSDQILASGGNERGRESIPDIARNLERFADLLVARVYHHAVVATLAECVSVPVINALCDKHHPTQALADVMAIQTHKGRNPNIKVAFVGDGNNVATSLMQVCAMLGMRFSIASPPDYQIPKNEILVGRQFAAESGAALEFLEDPEQAVADADVVYTDTFVSMGQEQEKTVRSVIFKRYQVNSKLMAKAKPDAIFMHCLPAHRGEEVTNEVIDSNQSIVFDQAECRLHIAKALFCYLMAT